MRVYSLQYTRSPKVPVRTCYTLKLQTYRVSEVHNSTATSFFDSDSDFRRFTLYLGYMPTWKEKSLDLEQLSPDAAQNESHTPQPLAMSRRSLCIAFLNECSASAASEPLTPSGGCGFPSLETRRL